MKAEIITIGDELLIGQVINTNQAYIAEKLTGIGISVDRMLTVSDDLEPILGAFREAWSRADVVVVTGGLGPTHDDITKKAVCDFFGTTLVSNKEVRLNIERLLQARNTPWNAASEEQTMFPESGTVMLNRLGSAAGILFEKDEKYFIALPGVPYEMTAIVSEEFIPWLMKRIKGPAIRQLTLRTTGISESNLAGLLGDLDALLQGARLAFLPSPSGVRLRITVQDPDPIAAENRVHSVETSIREKAAKHIFGKGDQELEETVGKLLTRRGLTISVAESCTGGLIADHLTDISGSSGYFDRGVIAYSDKSKSELLGVPAGLITEHGSVSREVAQAMAEGVRRISGTSIALSTTGIAGPTGATATKPVGLVWIGYADEIGSLAVRLNLGNDRRRVKERAVAAALDLVRRKLMKIE